MSKEWKKQKTTGSDGGGWGGPVRKDLGQGRKSNEEV